MEVVTNRESHALLCAPSNYRRAERERDGSVSPSQLLAGVMTHPRVGIMPCPVRGCVIVLNRRHDTFGKQKEMTVGIRDVGKEEGDIGDGALLTDDASGTS